MQEFVTAAFEKRMSTNAALDLLLQFQTILQREALQVSCIHRNARSLVFEIHQTSVMML